MRFGLSVTLISALALGAGIAGPAQGEDLYVGLQNGGIYRMDTNAMSRAPQLVVGNASFGSMQYQGLAAGCGSLYAMSSSKIVRINAATGAATDAVTNLGSGSPYGLAASADGTRVWWATDSGNVYTRLISDPPATAPTAILTGESLGPVPLLARVGNKIAVRTTSGGGVFDAASSPTSLANVAIGTSNQVFIGANETRAFYEAPNGGNGWKIGTINPFVNPPAFDDTFATVPAAAAGMIAANGSTVWVFEASQGKAYQIDIDAATPRTGYLVNSSVGGTAQGSAFETAALGCPGITGVAPAAGSPSGGTTITISGYNLTGVTGVTVGSNPATGVTVVNDSTVTAVTPAGTAGAKVTVGVTKADGSADAMAGAFTYSPSVASVSPNGGPAAGGQTVTITGTGFTGATAVSIGGTPVTSFTVVSDTEISAATPAGSAGFANVVVTTPAGTHTATDAYSYAAAQPTISSITPATGGEGGGTTITIVGTNMYGVDSVTVGGVAASNVSVLNGTTVTATVPPGAVGAVNVVVTNALGSATSAGGFTYAAGPTIATISPSNGPVEGGTQITITGTNLTGASAVQIDGNDVTTYTVNSATQITATTPPGRAGARTVAVTTAAGTVGKVGGFTYGVAPASAPTVSSVAPSSGTTLGGTSVIITGTDFTGASAVTFGGAAAAGYTVDSATQITATTPPGSAGAVGVSVTTPGGTDTKAGAFTYVAPEPAPGPSPAPNPAPAASPSATPNPAPTPASDIVTPSGAIPPRPIAEDQTRTTLRVRFKEDGRFSFFFQDATGKRIVMLKGSRVGSRVLKKSYSAPVVQDGKKGAALSIVAITRGKMPSGSMLRVILRRPDGSLVAQSIPVRP